jgi:hypothetical protein
MRLVRFNDLKLEGECNVIIGLSLGLGLPFYKNSYEVEEVRTALRFGLRLQTKGCERPSRINNGSLFVAQSPNRSEDSSSSPPMRKVLLWGSDKANVKVWRGLGLPHRRFGLERSE